MKTIDFYFDFVSPYAYLAFEQLPVVLQGHSYAVVYRPVLFAGLLQHHGQLGPAEIRPKRDWTYRQVAWLARRNGVELQLPASHPFNPLPYLRLALACGDAGAMPNRFVTETVFHHIWRGGADAGEAAHIDALVQRLAPRRDPHGDEVKDELKMATRDAVDQGLFGVPTMAVDGRHFWGFDALPMVRDHLDGDAWFDGGDWERAAELPVGIRRKP